MSVIDLGAAPGSWSQYTAKTVKNGRLISIDLKEMKKIENSYQIKGDFTKKDSQDKISSMFRSKVDVVLSDMAVNTTGIKDIDAIYTGELCKEAMLFSKKILVKNGKFVAKVFLGTSFNEIVKEAKITFKEVKIFKPKSSRKESKESFIICKNLR